MSTKAVRYITCFDGRILSTRIEKEILEKKSKTQIRGRRLEGQRFGKITCLSLWGYECKKHVAIWECRCDCGENCLISVSSFSPKKSIHSCGCVKRYPSNFNPISKSPEYGSWLGMKSRCSNPKDRMWKLYGGRGIKVCERWQTSFEEFLSDMGKKPSKHHSIERLDNNGDYEHGNCVWATSSQQANNRSNNRLITYDGITMTIAKWASKIGVSKSTLRCRLERGWSDSECITIPIQD